MIREIPQGRWVVPLDKLSPIQRVGITPDAIVWHAHDELPHRKQQRQPGKQPHAHAILEHIAPGIKAETVSVEYDYDDFGNVRTITVRDIAHGRVVRTVTRDELIALGGTSAAPGALFERRG